MTHSSALGRYWQPPSAMGQALSPQKREGQRTLVRSGEVPHIRETRLGGSRGRTERAAGTQKARLYGDTPHHHPPASRHGAPSGEQAEGNGGAALGPCAGSGRDEAAGGGAGDRPPPSIRRQGSRFLSAVVLNLSILVFCC